ncbi:MAG: helix-turn-helix domain-containing protein [Cyanobacteria bacterium P01_D01_bin.115]
MLDISEVSKRSGQPASTLRYYEERGLIQSAGRRGLRRIYEPQVLERLAMIALGQAAGFSLNEIQNLFKASDGLNIDREALIAKADELDEMIQKLIVVRDGLRSTAVCPAPSHMECPNFRRVLSSAGRGLIPPLEKERRRKPV